MPPKNRATAAEWARRKQWALNLHAGGMRSADIALEVDANYWTISKWLREAGVKANRPTIIKRFFAKVVFGERFGDLGRCMEWTARLHQGYGYFQVDGASVGAYRWLYERWFGPVPAGLHLDHLCRNRSCVNPAHLEPVTQGENSRRGIWGQLNEERAAIPFCIRGHAHEPRKPCKQCNAFRQRAYYQRQRTAQ